MPLNQGSARSLPVLQAEKRAHSGTSWFDFHSSTDEWFIGRNRATFHTQLDKTANNKNNVIPQSYYRSLRILGKKINVFLYLHDDKHKVSHHYKTTSNALNPKFKFTIPHHKKQLHFYFACFFSGILKTGQWTFKTSALLYIFHSGLHEPVQQAGVLLCREWKLSI